MVIREWRGLAAIIRRRVAEKVRNPTTTELSTETASHSPRAFHAPSVRSSLLGRSPQASGRPPSTACLVSSAAMIGQRTLPVLH